MAVELLKVKDSPDSQDYPLYLQQMKVFIINFLKKTEQKQRSVNYAFRPTGGGVGEAWMMHHHHV